MSEITGVIIDEFSSLTPEQQDRIVFLATPDPEATKSLINMFVSHFNIKITEEDVERLKGKLSKIQAMYLDSDVGVPIHERAVTTATLPPKKQHKQPFWTKDWRKRR